ncbi:hypothetical protein [Psychromonas sp. SR45-3]|uniref:hypothetical protein n=1 Tax=Psychromonas sp. SR45-3 TaxID=2760930 RepID=UPI0015FE3ADD|nr:hypothetical protein [Psychromonas sp. SR45-3]MBB1274592.1 hypothetical protein [Psychromonas sp. SR45-3]
MGKKNRKVKYDVVETLRFKSFPPEYEELTKNLYTKACKGSEHLWNQINTVDDLRNNKELKDDFYTSANKGMKSAQDEIVSIVQSKDKLDFSKELLLRGIADAIAWQLLGHQLCHARRFFKSIKQPDLYNCNFDSVVFAAKDNDEKKPSSISLISDLTSFIQVGDLLICDPKKGITIAEVKEGVMNAKIGDFMKFYMESQCDRALYYFAEKEGDKAVKQLQRMFRQASRMSHVSTVMSTGQGVDPDTKETINIPEPFFEIESWDDRLVNTLNEADKKGWAIDVIDNCVFLGVYASEEARMGGHIIFNSWFDNSGGTPECPRALLIDSMRNPLALPVFSRNLPDNHKFDVLFGRKQVCMAICIESLLKECEKVGLSVRFATNKERGRLDKTGNRPYKHKGKAIFIGNGKTEVVLMDGIFLRVMHHGQSPISLIKMMIDGMDKTT